MKRREFLRTTTGILVTAGLAGCTMKQSGYYIKKSTINSDAAASVTGHILEYRDELAIGIYVQEPDSLAVVPPWVDVKKFFEWSFTKQRKFTFNRGEGIWFLDKNSHSKKTWRGRIKKKHKDVFGSYDTYTIADTGPIDAGDKFTLVRQTVEGDEIVGHVVLGKR